MSWKRADSGRLINLCSNASEMCEFDRGILDLAERAVAEIDRLAAALELAEAKALYFSRRTRRLMEQRQREGGGK